jgi:hypothetical protein
MANEFKHKSVGTELTQTEFEAVGGHVLDSQARGDIVYASSTTQLSRLAVGGAGAVLTSDGTDPVWDITWSPTGHLIPASDDSYDLGSASAAWQDLFLEGDISLTDAGSISTAAGALTIGSAAAINITPAAGSAILLDGTISIDAGVVTGATSITSTAFVGDITGDITGNADTATLATTVTATANNSTDETVFPTFVDGATSAQGIETDTGLTYNPSTGVLTSTSFTGNVTGNVTGNASGTAATVTTAAQTNITSLGTLTALTVSGLITANGGITFADGDDITFTGATGTNDIVLVNGLADALSITDGSADVLTISTAGGTNTVAITGDLTVSGTIAADTATTASVATTVTITDNEDTDEANAIIFTSGGDLDGGNIGLESDGTLNYNPSTGTLTTTTFAGALTGTAATVTTNANLTGDVTSSGNATAIASGVIVDADVNASAAIAISKTALVAGTNITLATNTLNVDDAFLKNDASDTTTGTITAAGFTAGDAGQVYFSDTAPASDHTATGVVISIASGESVAAFNSVYIRSDGEVGPADADAASTMPAIGVALEAKGDGEATKILVAGVLRDDTYNFTPGADLFIGTTAGEITATAPSGSGDTVQKVGVALTADSIYVNFNTTEVLLA